MSGLLPSVDLVLSYQMLQRSNNPKNNTGYQGLSLRKVQLDDGTYDLSMIASVLISGKYLRKEFRLDEYSLEDSMRLAMGQLYEWHGSSASSVILNNLDLTKAKAWLEENQADSKAKTNTGLEAVKIVKQEDGWYVLATWLDPDNKSYQVKYASIEQYGYLDALRIAVIARSKALGLPVPNITATDAEQGVVWIRSQ